MPEEAAQPPLAEKGAGQQPARGGAHRVVPQSPGQKRGIRSHRGQRARLPGGGQQRREAAVPRRGLDEEEALGHLHGEAGRLRQSPGGRRDGVHPPRGRQAVRPEASRKRRMG